MRIEPEQQVLTRAVADHATGHASLHRERVEHRSSVLQVEVLDPQVHGHQRPLLTRAEDGPNPPARATAAAQPHQIEVVRVEIEETAPGRVHHDRAAAGETRRQAAHDAQHLVGNDPLHLDAQVGQQRAGEPRECALQRGFAAGKPQAGEVERERVSQDLRHAARAGHGHGGVGRLGAQPVHFDPDRAVTGEW